MTAYVADMSYFSGKLEAYLRYKELSYERRVVTSKVLRDEVLPATGLMGRVAAFNALMVTAQLGAGVALVWGDLPPTFQVVHVLVASLLAGGLYVQYMLTSRPAA